MRNKLLKNLQAFFSVAIISLTVAVATSATALAAAITPPTFATSVSAGAGGTVSPAGAGGILGGSTMVVSIAPNPGFQIADIQVNGLSVGTTTLYVQPNVASNITLYATFSPIPAPTYNIISTTGPNGTISPLGTISVTTGTGQTYNILPAPGFQVDTLTVDGSFVATSTSYSFPIVTASHTINATFMALPKVPTPPAHPQTFKGHQETSNYKVNANHQNKGSRKKH